MYEKYIKRAIDFVLSAIGIVLLLWLYLILALAIVIDDPGPVFFKQKRVGKGKTIFDLYNILERVRDIALCNKAPKMAA